MNMVKRNNQNKLDPGLERYTVIISVFCCCCLSVIPVSVVHDCSCHVLDCDFAADFSSGSCVYVWPYSLYAEKTSYACCCDGVEGCLQGKGSLAGSSLAEDSYSWRHRTSEVDFLSYNSTSSHLFLYEEKGNVKLN